MKNIPDIIDRNLNLADFNNIWQKYF